MNNNPLPRPQADWALFLDFDGTLVELESHPDQVRPAPEIPALLDRLARPLDGAIAIVSGRGLESLQSLLGTDALPMAGVHGLERRDADGRVHRPIDPAERFESTREAFREFVTAHPGTYFEDKGTALALHYRNAPRAQAPAERFLEAERERLGDGFQLQRGKFVFELKPAGQDKGTVVATFLEEPPFRGRTPVFVGDDVTDEDAFRVVRERGGHAIRVGDIASSAAAWHIGSVKEVVEWLAQIANTLEKTPPAPP